MRRIVKSVFPLAALGIALLEVVPPAVQAQPPVVLVPTPPTVSYMPVRRGLFGLRQAYVPVVNPAGFVPVPAAVGPVTPVRVAQPIVVNNQVTVARPVVVGSEPGWVPASPVIVNRPIVTAGPVIHSQPVIVNHPVIVELPPAPANVWVSPAW